MSAEEQQSRTDPGEPATCMEEGKEMSDKRDVNDVQELLSSASSEEYQDALSVSPLNFDVSQTSAEGDKRAERILDQVPAPKNVTYTETSHLAGEDDPKQDSMDEGSSKLRYYENRDAKITPSPVIQYVLDNDLPWDTVIGCADGKLGAHRLVLASASPFIGDLFTYDHRLGELATLILPDVKVAVMKVILNFCYTGTIFFPVEDEAEVIGTLKLLNIGEFADLTLKEVTVKLPPTPAPITAEQSEDPQQIDDEMPGPSSAFRAISASRSMEVIPIDSDSNEDDDSSSEHENPDDDEKENENIRHTQPEPANVRAEEMARIDFANTYHKNKDLHESSISYLIPPKEPGSKTKKFFCGHCPAAFKSMDTLEAHLDNNHSIIPQSRNLTQTEFDKLTDCTYCPKHTHTSISTANACLSKHSRTRCMICCEVIRLRRFDEHIKGCHSVVLKNSICTVKCRWCDAGLLIREPIDNKAMSAHCFGTHFPGGKKNVNIQMDKEDKSELTVMLPSPSPGPAIKQEPVEKVQMPPPTPPLLENKKTKQQSMDFFLSSSVPSTPKSASSKGNSKQQVPAVLALLQKASQKKRKQEPDCESNHATPTRFENPKKRARLDANGKRLQVAKRTGIPVGRQVDLNRLKDGIPTFKPVQRNKGKSKSVLIDVTKLPQMLVNLKYSKTYILDLLTSNQRVDEHLLANPSPNKERSGSTLSNPTEQSQSSANACSDTTVREHVEVPGKANSDTDSGCCLP